MPNVYWSDEARTAFEALSPDIQQEITQHLDLLRHFPELYQRIEFGRYRGLRRFLVRRHYHVYYRVLGDNQDCFIRVIRPARAQPE